MNIRLTFFSAILAFALLPSTAYAQDACSNGARKLAAQQKATIIAVQPKKIRVGKPFAKCVCKRNLKMVPRRASSSSNSNPNSKV